MIHEGKIIDALYFSTSNGYTEDSELVFGFELPYLRSVESDWDKEVSPVFNSQKVININEFYFKLGLPYKEKITIEEIEKSITGRILNLKINDRSFVGRDVRFKLGIRSTDFNIVQENDLVYIYTNGFGHGVGMSQYGANGMAFKGYKYKEILTYYYQNIAIKKI